MKIRKFWRYFPKNGDKFLEFGDNSTRNGDENLKLGDFISYSFSPTDKGLEKSFAAGVSVLAWL